jgi:hypothetical protein
LKEKEKLIKEACSNSEAEDKDKQTQELRDRAAKVASIFEAAGVLSKTETEKAERIISFTKSAMSLEEIAFLASTMSPDYKSNSNKSVGVF